MLSGLVKSLSQQFLLCSKAFNLVIIHQSVGNIFMGEFDILFNVILICFSPFYLPLSSGGSRKSRRGM